MHDPQWNVCYILPDVQGGAYTVVQALIERGLETGVRSHLILTRRTDSPDLPVLSVPNVPVSRLTLRGSLGNLRTDLRRLAAEVPEGPGVLVCNDLLDLAMLSVYPTERTVIQIVHGDYDYYYGLAKRHAPAIDVFTAGSRPLFSALCERLPERADSIFHLPYGAPVAPRTRRWTDGPLRLIVSARLSEGKGVRDLPVIDRALADRGVSVEWTVIGDGPEQAGLAEWFASPHVTWTGILPRPEVLAAYPRHDVLVFPTRAEGFSLTLLEAMGAGTVPVVSAIPAVRDVVTPGETGLLGDPTDPLTFADAIESLFRSPADVARMSRAAQQLVLNKYEDGDRLDAYLDLFADWKRLRRPERQHVPLPYGSRLDQPWIPDLVVRTLRTANRFVSK